MKTNDEIQFTQYMYVYCLLYMNNNKNKHAIDRENLPWSCNAFDMVYNSAGEEVEVEREIPTDAI